MDQRQKLQLHLTLPYKFEPREHPRVLRYLETGFRISQLQRLTDREALVTLVRDALPPKPEQPLTPSGA